MQDLDQIGMCYQFMWAFESKLHTCIQFTVCVHYIIVNATSQYYTQYKFSQYLYSVQVQLVFISIDIPSIQFQLFFPTYYLLSFVTHLVLFTISSPNGGVPEVRPSSSGQQCMYVEPLKIKTTVSLLVCQCLVSL